MDWSAAQTIAGVATPPGEGAVAIVRLSGDHALASALRIFQPKQHATPFEPRSHQLYFGKFVEPESRELIDEGLLCCMHKPHSFTGENVVELHLHGGNTIANRVLQALLKQSQVRQALSGEFSFRAFLNKKIDLVQAEAISELIRSRSYLDHKFAMQRLAGGMQEPIKVMGQKLATMLSHIEVELDFPDESFETQQQSQHLALLQQQIQQLQLWITQHQWHQRAKRLPTVCLAGPPNVGKSTLFNALLGQERALVSAEAGTTRDYLDVTLQWQGVELRLVDTAGLREMATSSIEQAGIDKSYHWLQQADIVLWVDDPTTIDKSVLPQLGHNEVPLWVALNKIDSLSKNEQTGWQNHPKQPKHLVSAKTGSNIDVLRQELFDYFLREFSQVRDISICANERQAELLRAIYDLLLQAENEMKHNKGHERVAALIWQAARKLGEITGEELAPKVVESIFSNFCIGK